jgi:hypothetical protein
VFQYYLCFCFGSLKVVGREQKVCCMKTNMKHNALFYPFGCEIMLSLFFSFFLFFGGFWLNMSFCFVFCFSFLSDLLFIEMRQLLGMLTKKEFLIPSFSDPNMGF